MLLTSNFADCNIHLKALSQMDRRTMTNDLKNLCDEPSRAALTEVVGLAARTTDEIVARIKSVEATDAFGFQVSDLVLALPFDAAKPWLRDDATSDDWVVTGADPEAALNLAHDYMDFAWGKANDQRGISAWRSLCHMQAWLWLARQDSLIERLRLEEYSHYGKPQLRAICEHFGWDWRKWDDGEWCRNEGDDGLPPESVACPLQATAQ